jgi:hypothetical protein
MTSRALLLLALLWFASVPTVKAQPPSGARAQLVDAAVLRGRFEQDKQLQGFRNPLRSNGDFLLVRDRGVIWETRAPFASTTVLTRDRLLQRQPDGGEQIVLDAAHASALAALNALLMALIRGDLDALAQQFEIEEQVDGDGWRLDLTPTDAGLQRVLTAVSLGGDRHVRSARIVEKSGDRSEIRFLELDDSSAPLTTEESARFD